MEWDQILRCPLPSVSAELLPLRPLLLCGPSRLPTRVPQSGSGVKRRSKPSGVSAAWSALPLSALFLRRLLPPSRSAPPQFNCDCCCCACSARAELLWRQSALCCRLPSPCSLTDCLLSQCSAMSHCSPTQPDSDARSASIRRGCEWSSSAPARRLTQQLQQIVQQQHAASAAACTAAATGVPVVPVASGSPGASVNTSLSSTLYSRYRLVLLVELKPVGVVTPELA